MSEEKKVDPETQKIIDQNSLLLELTSHHAWKEARKIIVEKIIELQNVAEYIDIIQTGNATKLLKEMKANKRAAEILFDFLRTIEGSADAALDSKKPTDPGYIVRIED